MIDRKRKLTENGSRPPARRNKKQLQSFSLLCFGHSKNFKRFSLETSPRLTMAAKPTEKNDTSLFSCDLVAQSKLHVQFLQELHALGITLQCATPTNLCRYLEHWLPLVHAHRTEQALIPPPDVAFLWHCHRLAPSKYERYCQIRFGTILEAKPPFSFQSPNDTVASDRTQELWEARSPNVPFFWKSDDENNIKLPEAVTLCGKVDGFDLVASTTCQAGFLWQVSDKNFHDDMFLQQGVDNYHKFLQLQSDDLPLVPTYQIDLMWHTHMLSNTGLYNLDCEKIRGARFHHDDSLNDRTPGATLDVAFSKTSDLWEAAYHVPYSVPGGTLSACSILTSCSCTVSHLLSPLRNVSGRTA